MEILFDFFNSLGQVLSSFPPFITNLFYLLSTIGLTILIIRLFK